MLRIFLIVAGLLFFANTSAAATADTAELPVARDIRALAEEANTKRLPIMLVVSQTGCSYCELLMREIIQPMIISGDYRDKVLMRELSIDPHEHVRDFGGERVLASEFANRYDAYATPTLLFLDDQGREMVPAIRGINTVELYGFYVDKSIERAVLQLRGTTQASQ